MVSTFMFYRIRSLRDQGKGNREIARELDIDRKTVAKYLASNTPPKSEERVHRTRENLFKVFEVKARAIWDKNEKITSTEIYELLKEDGYAGSERTVRRRVGDWKVFIPKERYFEQVYEPGEQAQFDFKEKVELPFADGPKIVQLHFGTLPFCDYFSIKGYPFKNYECYIDGIHSFFEKIGGITRNIRFDNLSPCVKKVLRGNERIYTNSFKEAIKYYGFGTLPCSPGKGNEKGDVEREIRTHSSRIKNLIRHQGIFFKDFEHLNVWLNEYASKRLTDKKIENLNIERKLLLPLPVRCENILFKVELSKGSAYGTVRSGKSVYSVPDFMIGQGVRVAAGPYNVKIYRINTNSDCVAIHTRKPDGESSILLEHVLPSLIRKPNAIVRWAHREILFSNPVFKKFFQYLKQIEPMGAEKEFLKSINLVQHTALADIELGMQLIIDASSIDPFVELKELITGAKDSINVIEISKQLKQKPLETNLGSYDNLVPKKGGLTNEP